MKPVKLEIMHIFVVGIEHYASDHNGFSKLYVTVQDMCELFMRENWSAKKL
jgi:hypothetical protein